MSVDLGGVDIDETDLCLSMSEVDVLSSGKSREDVGGPSLSWCSHVDERGKGLLFMFLIFLEADCSGGDTIKSVTDAGDCEHVLDFSGEYV